MKAVLLALLAMAALSGCDGAGYSVVEAWAPMDACAKATGGVDVLQVCGYGAPAVYKWDDPKTRPVFTCQAEWRHNGTTAFKTSAPCGPDGGGTDQILPTLDGTIHWWVEHDQGGIDVGCRLSLTTPSGQYVEADGICAHRQSVMDERGLR